ncbi:hypothetical protein TBLA_0B09900 [Henningerozyma blattae CBS 6284]|uniref:tRNA wybutosine-synthesizing protein 3 n=1 Tax=Henningerozyma blattae (strain ATCC 34711 / CBS 6284 / DSM 70876 / NBRC 10599 / NRRL Y-10934 / UCD 77-7) TaxID=1071380 RepID=I2H0A6_HENB6|nr:hypothetical protein TBLA_0B09900 [Tetrapisispora blattae CBS 6284]CCH59808.1 hypothetical protein TBLA_0B09900 [Tetrapisispora blattae CBS 6284]
MGQNAFDQKKNAILEEINSTDLDLSPKGTIDELCLPIMKLINSHRDMVTTSSCSGRLSVFVEGNKVHNKTVKVGGKGDGGKWLFVTHNQDEVLGWLNNLENKNTYFQPILTPNSTPGSDGSTRLILYKYEPFILHVKCRDLESASALYNVAMSCGFRESGIGSNFIVAIRINIKLDVPIGYVDETTDAYNLLVPLTYIELLDQLTFVKFEDNAKKIQYLYNKIENEIINHPIQNVATTQKKEVETKEDRRIRKRKEGLERQRRALEEKLLKQDTANIV